jgi:Acetyltransferase (GNAT) domain
MPQPSIQYLLRSQIDTLKWDNCISGSRNGLIYAYSFYLDHMALSWDALVLGDYEVVMPLPWKKKYGIYYLPYTPFIASLGVFGSHVTEDITRRFIEAIPRKFKLVDILLNKDNFLPDSDIQFSRNNYVLDLNSSYEDIYSRYRNNVRRNIRKAQQLDCRYATAIPVEEIIKLAHWQLQPQPGTVKEEDYMRFTALFNDLLARQQALTCGVYTSNNELVASCVYFFSHRRVYYILVGNHPNGKTLGASHYLIDRFIATHAGQDLLLDFEGSDVPGLAFFYSSFGSYLESYPALRFQRLPWWLQWRSKGFNKWRK